MKRNMVLTGSQLEVERLAALHKLNQLNNKSASALGELSVNLHALRAQLRETGSSQVAVFICVKALIDSHPNPSSLVAILEKMQPYISELISRGPEGVQRELNALTRDAHNRARSAETEQ